MEMLKTILDNDLVAHDLDYVKINLDPDSELSEYYRKQF